MKQIILNKRFQNSNFVALVDDEDYERVDALSWYVNHIHKNIYACNKSNSKTLYMHRFIINPPNEMQIDHIDGNGLNNQKSNLRICTANQNKANRKSTQGTSKYIGVFKFKPKCNNNYRWYAEIYHNGKKIRIGVYKTENEAALAYNKKAVELRKEFANTNTIIYES